MNSPADAEDGSRSSRSAARTATRLETRAPDTSGLLVVVGDLLEDIVVWASEDVRDATDTRAQVFRSRGGSGANVAAFAATLVPTRFIGRIGADAAGDALATTLEAHGVDVLVQRRGRTGAVVLLVTPDGERSMFPDRAAAAELDAVDSAWLDGIAWLHVPSYGFERDLMRAEIVRLVRAARVRGATISVDVSSTGLIAQLGSGTLLGILRDLSPDVLFANGDEAAALGLAALESAGGVAPTILVKRGADPTEVAESSTVTTVGVAAVDGVRDATGAGDAFAAGFIAARMRGEDAADACRAGHRLAASVLTSPGATLDEGSTRSLERDSTAPAGHPDSAAASP